MLDRCFMILTACTFTIAHAGAANPDLAGLAEHKQWTKVTASLDKGVDPNQVQADGMTALHWAALRNQSTVAKQLVDHGADVDATTRYHVTPLSLACEYGNSDVANVLIESDADISVRRMGKETPLMLAARNGSAPIVSHLIDAGATIDAKEVGGQTSLMWAASAGNTAVVKVLVDAGADISYTLPGSGFSAPLFAARQGRTEIMKVFVEAGFDIGTAIETKRKGGRDPRTGMSALMLAVESGHLELALWLVEKGADPNDQRSGFAPLHAVTWVRRTERGDDPNGDPAPRITGSIHTLQFVSAIVNAGADVNLQILDGKSKGGRLNPKGATPFFLASRGADLALMKLLLGLGADPMITNADGTTALMAAAGVGVIAVGEEPGTPEEVDTAIRVLFELGIDPNVVDRKKETAMHGAALRTFPSTVAVLAELGADPSIWNQENRRGWTPHEIAGGQRPGSVKPSPETIAALDAALTQQQ